MGLKKISEVIGKAGVMITKHAPVIFTVVGVAGVGATAVLSYKAKDKVEDIVDKIEKSTSETERIEQLIEEINNPVERLTDEEHYNLNDTLTMLQASHEEYTRMDIVRDVAGAVALPVATGVLSVAAIVLSYTIQNNRIGSLAAALATSATEQALFKSKYKEKHGEEEYNKFVSTHREDVEFTNKKGEVKTKTVDIRDDMASMNQFWYDQSEHYVSDDHDYNVTFINTRLSEIDLSLFTRGTISLNSVLQALGFQPTKAGAAVGWSAGNFQAETRNVKTYNEVTGKDEDNLLVVFSQPTYIYDKIDYTDTLLSLC